MMISDAGSGSVTVGNEELDHDHRDHDQREQRDELGQIHGSPSRSPRPRILPTLTPYQLKKTEMNSTTHRLLRSRSRGSRTPDRTTYRLYSHCPPRELPVHHSK